MRTPFRLRQRGRGRGGCSSFMNTRPLQRVTTTKGKVYSGGLHAATMSPGEGPISSPSHMPQILYQCTHRVLIVVEAQVAVFVRGVEATDQEALPVGGDKVLRVRLG